MDRSYGEEEDDKYGCDGNTGNVFPEVLALVGFELSHVRSCDRQVCPGEGKDDKDNQQYVSEELMK